MATLLRILPITESYPILIRWVDRNGADDLAKLSRLLQIFFGISVAIASCDVVLASPQPFWIFEDESGELTVQQVYARRDAYDPGFEMPSYGLTKSHIWIYLSAADFKSVEDVWFEIDNAGINHVKLYQVADSNLDLILETGGNYPYQSRLLDFRSYVLPLKFSEQQEYLIELYGEIPMLLPVYVGTPESMFQYLIHRENLVTMMYGIIVAMAIFNLLLFVITRHIPFGWYSLYMLCMFTTLCFVSGIGNAYIWRDQYWFQNHMAYVVVVLSIWSAFNFTRTFLATKHTLPNFDQYFRWIVHTPLLTFLIAPFGMSNMLILTSVFLALLVVTVLILGVISVAIKVEGAILFLAGWLILVLGLFCYNLTVLGVVPASELGRFSALISVSLESVLLSFAVIYRTQKIERLAHQKVRRANKEIQQVLQKVENSNAAKDAFVASISHHLKTPIHIVMGNLQLMAEELQSSEHIKLVEQTDRYATELLFTIDNLLTYNQVVSSDLRHLRQRLNIRSEFMRMEHKWRHLYENNNVHFELSFDPRIPARIEVDWIHVRKVIRIALENAANRVENGRVCISLKRITNHGEDWLEILIQDNSGGIPDPVCQWFNDLNADERWDRSSLGLYLTKHLVQHVGGHSTLSNLAEGGVQFVARWPVICLPDNDTAVETKINGQVILVVDDMAVNRKLMNAMLKKMKVVPVLATSGLEAIEIVSQQVVDLVLMDCQMPGLSGQETSRILREEGKLDESVPIIAISANDSDMDRESCLYAGINDFLAKPVRIQTLEQKLKYWLIKDSSHLTNPVMIL